MTAYTFTLTINGKTLPMEQFRVTGGVFGSVGHLTATSSLSALAALKIDVYTMAAEATAPLETYLTVQKETGKPVRLFGGEFMNATWDYDNDKIEIHARDWAGQLVDQKRVLTSISKQIIKLLAPLAPGQNPNSQGVSNINQSLTQIVTAIAQEVSMTPVLNLTGGVPGNTQIGALYGSGDHALIQVQQNLWQILNHIARDTGYEVYVTPNKQLVFGQGGVGIDPIKLTWKVGTVPQGSYACKSLHIQHHPRRNATFRVLVFSYDPGKGQQTTGHATVVGSNLGGSAGLKPGIWLGADALAADKKLASVQKGGVTVSQVPLYSFRFDGLTQDQATQKAQTIAIDISKRELIMNCVIAGLPEITPTGKINISGAVDPNFASNDFYVNGFEHQFSMGSSGFVTHIKALDIPTLGTGGQGNEGGPTL